jgi:CheY-like chemotaxis protein
VLKIDRGFVQDMSSNEASRRIVAAVTGLAQGLGLDVVAEGVEQAGLAVDLRALGCDRAQGFAFARPLPAEELARMLAAAPPPAAPSTELIRVFVCDDSDDLRVLLRATLEEDPAIRIVGEAGDGVDIIEGIRGAMADVVLMDLAMPRVDGLEAIRILRAWRADLGIIVLSGYEQERMRAQATALGADRYVEKRSPISQLRAAIHEVGESRRGPRPGRRYRARRSAA